jgi:hypothetical protein
MNVIQTDQAPAASALIPSRFEKRTAFRFRPARPRSRHRRAGRRRRSPDRRALQNLVAILAAAGLGPKNVLKATINVANMDDFALVNKTLRRNLRAAVPGPRSRQAARLPKNGLVEISAIAAP